MNNGTMVHISIAALLIGGVSLRHATAGQAGWTTFIADTPFGGLLAFDPEKR